MVYFNLWRSESSGRVRRYNCQSCVDEKGTPKSFKFCFLNDKHHTIGTFELDKQGQPVRTKDGKGTELNYVYDVGADDFIYIVSELQESHPQNPPLLEVITTYYPDVCPMSLIDQTFDQVIVWELFSQEYGGYPFNGGLIDQPNKLIDAYIAIMATRNEFYRVREEKMKKRMKEKEKQDRTKSSIGNLRKY